MIKMVENGMLKLKHLVDCIIEISSLQMGIFNMQISSEFIENTIDELIQEF